MTDNRVSVTSECVTDEELNAPRWIRSCRSCGAAATDGGNARHYAMCAFTDGGAIR